MPFWRGSSGAAWPLSRESPPSSESWNTMAKGGRNGLLILIIALSWWLETGKSKQGVMSIIEDLAWSLERINSVLESRGSGQTVSSIFTS